MGKVFDLQLVIVKPGIAHGMASSTHDSQIAVPNATEYNSSESCDLDDFVCTLRQNLVLR